MCFGRLIIVALGLVVMTSAARAQTAETEEPEADLPSIESLKKGLIDTTPGFYLSPILSVSYTAGDVEAIQEIDGTAIIVDDEFDGTLVRLGGALGYQVSFLRNELELTIGRSDTEIKDANQDVTLDFFKFSALSLFDVPYDLSKPFIDNGPEIRPYAGFGIGGFYYDFEGGDSDVAFVAEVLAGLGIRISPRWFIDGGYRWTYIPILENEGVTTEVAAHGIEAKLRYRF